MSHTRTRAVDAALTLLGTEGIHALTHGRVDAAADLPKGSASNHFRTRAALVRGAVERLEEKDREIWATLHDVPLADDEHLAEALTGYVTAATTTYRVLASARYALAAEGAHDPEVGASLARGAEALHRWTARIARDLGAPDPEAATRTLTAYVDGLVMRGLTRPDVAEPPSQVLRVVRACLR